MLCRIVGGYLIWFHVIYSSTGGVNHQKMQQCASKVRVQDSYHVQMDAGNAGFTLLKTNGLRGWICKCLKRIPHWRRWEPNLSVGIRADFKGLIFELN